MNANDLMISNPVAERVSMWVREYSAKDLAKMFGASERTARGWRDGNMPQNIHIIAMAQRWGMNFLEDVYAPVLGGDVKPEHRLERIEHDIRALRGNARAIVSLVIVLLTTFGPAAYDDPFVRAPRAPRPAPARSRRNEA